MWEGHNALGKRWVEISAKFFKSTRSENHIKNRWYSASFKKFITNEFGPDAYKNAVLEKEKDSSGNSIGGGDQDKENGDQGNVDQTGENGGKENSIGGNVSGANNEVADNTKSAPVSTADIKSVGGITGKEEITNIDSSSKVVLV